MKSSKTNDLKPCRLVVQFAEIGHLLQKVLFIFFPRKNMKNNFCTNQLPEQIEKLTLHDFKSLVSMFKLSFDCFFSNSMFFL